MAAHGWRSGRPLSQQVRREFAGFNFFQLVRLLLRERDKEFAPGSRIDDVVRFRADLSSAFPGHEVTRLIDRGKRSPVTVTTPNYVVAGYLGPLPEPFSDWLQNRARDGDRVMADFLDLFNHRFNALRYQIKTHRQLGLDSRAPEETLHAGYLAALMGMAAPGLAEQLPLPRRAWLGIAGLLANCRNSAPVVTAVLSAYLGAKAGMRQLCGAWRDIEKPDQTRLGVSSSRLGRESVLGARVWDEHARVEVTVGPIDYSRFCMLLPGERAHAGFVALLRFLLDRRFDCQVRFLVKEATLPAPTLTARPDQGAQPGRPGYWGLRLGFSAWLAGRATPEAWGGTRDAAYLVRAFEPMETA